MPARPREDYGFSHCRQHLLNFFPLPQAHGSFAPSFRPSRRTVSCFGKAGRKLGSLWSVVRTLW